MKRRSSIVRILLPVLAAVIAGGSFVAAAARADTATTTISAAASTLQEQIQQKQQQLNSVNAQIASTTAVLKQVQTQRVTLQQQVNLINGNISTLNLGIQSDTLTAQQLALEIEQLQGDIKDIQASVALKQAAIASILQQVERSDTTNGNLLALFIKSGSLANGVLEANSLLNLRSQLASNIDTLKSLNDQYSQKIQASGTKQQQVVQHQQDLQNKKAIVQDQQAQKTSLLATTKGQESVFQQQVNALKKQQTDIATQIEAIAAILRTKIDPSTLPALGPGVLGIPAQGITKANVTQGYGATAFAKNGYAGHWHNGIDFGMSIGTPVVAAEAGKIMAVANEDLYCPRGAYGKFIVINHTNGLTTLYGHLSRQIVSVGQTVARGQVIGYSGQTGYATGPHLHFTVFAQTTYYLSTSKSCGPLPQGGDLNPLGYLF